MKLCSGLTILWSSDDDRQLWVEANTGHILSMTLQSLNTGLILQYREQKNNFVELKKCWKFILSEYLIMTIFKPGNPRSWLGGHQLPR